MTSRNTNSPGNMTLPKEDNKFSVCDPKEMEIYKLAGKVFKMIILRKLKKLP